MCAKEATLKKEEKKKKSKISQKSQKSKKSKKTPPVSGPAIVHPEAAGIDIGATEIYVAVRADRSEQPVRCFTTFTDDLNRLGDWLLECQVTTVAMESTGVYWVPLYQILEDKGLKVNLVNARDVKNVPGRKTDVQDCQWLHTLHTHGLLRGSFRPAQEICAIRTVHRFRTQYVETAACYIQHIQKSLSLMNLQIHHVLSDITGTSGLAMLDAIVAGERNPKVLARLRDPRVKATLSTIERSLTGNWQEEHLFTLERALKSYRFFLEEIKVCDAELKALTEALEPQAKVELPPEHTTGKRKGKKALGLADPSLSWEKELYRVFGVNLLEVPGISIKTTLTFLSEVGPDLSRFATVHHFCSWLRLAPQNKISGGVILSARTPKQKPHLAIALRIGA